MIPRALAIAGSDPCGGAGIQQDLKTFQTLGVWGMSAITSVTVQNTLGVSERHDLDPGLVEAQIRAVVEDLGVDAVKTGMLGTAEVVRRVARAVTRLSLPNLVVDPVILSGGGARLLDQDAIGALAELLVSLAVVVTPNAAEATALTGIPVWDRASQHEAARALVALGARAAVVTGGHLPGDPVDVLFDGSEAIELAGERIDSPATHGTGCLFSAAIAAGLAHGQDIVAAARLAKQLVARGIRQGLALGGGTGPVNPVPLDRDGA